MKRRSFFGMLLAFFATKRPACQATTGSSAYTGVGFKPDCVYLVSEERKNIARIFDLETKNLDFIVGPQKSHLYE